MLAALKENIERTVGRKVPDDNCSIFSSYLFEKTFDKKDILIEAGHVCKYIYFIKEGSCYSHFNDEKGETHDLKCGDCVSIEPMVKHWVDGIDTCQLVLLK